MLQRKNELKAKRKNKPGIEIAIPGFGSLHVKAICCDYTGTLSCAGRLIRGVEKRLRKLSRIVDIHVVTSDTRRTANRELQVLTQNGRVTLKDKIARDVCHDEFKEKYLRGLELEPRDIVVFGNGRNDALWLKAVKDAQGLAVAVDVGEGCAGEAMNNATIFVSDITNALDLLLDPKRIIGTLRTQ